MPFKSLKTLIAFVFCAAAPLLQAASPFAGFYVGQMHTSISGTITMPERPIGPVAFTVSESGVVTSSGDLTGTVTDAGVITWNANVSGFATGQIANDVLTSSGSVNNNGTISHFRVEARSSAPGAGQGNALGGRIEQLNPTQALRNMNRVRFAGDQFVAVGAQGAFATSPDGVNWTRSGVPTTLDLHDVAYGNGRFVVVGDSAARFWSSNGVDWTASGTAGSPLPYAAVAFGNGKFVSMNATGATASSTDGAAWTSGPPMSGGLVYSGLDFINGEFVAWSGNRIAFSADASNWETKTGLPGVGDLTVSLDTHNKVAYGSGVYLAGGVQGLASSSNGTTWTKLTNAPGSFFGSIASVTYGARMFVVCDTADDLWISSNGQQWRKVDRIEFRSLAHGAGKFVGVGNDLGVSSDGALWILPEDDDLRADSRESGYVDPHSEAELVGQFSESSSGTYSFGRNGRISWYKHQFAGGSGEAPRLTSETLRFGMNMRFGEAPVIVGNRGTIIVAEDRAGVTFQLVPPVTTADLVHGAKGVETLVFVGTQGTIIRTDNYFRTNWTVSASGTTAHLKHVAWYPQDKTTLPGMFIAAGEGGVLLTSADGRAWTRRDTGLAADIVGSAYHNSPRRFLAAASDGALLESADGVVWTRAGSLPAPRALRWFRNTDPNLGNFAISGGGDNGLVISLAPDGSSNFTMGSPPAFSRPRLTDAALGNGRHVVVGNQISAISTDGREWISRANAWSFQGVAYGEGKFVAAGPGALAVSGDGLRWQTNGMVSNAQQFRAAGYGGGKFVAVGDNGLIWVSEDGANWMSKNISTSVDYNDIAWSNGVFVGGGTGGTLLISTDSGDTWAERPAFIQEIKGVAYGNGRFVAVGQAGWSAASTNNGASWEAKQMPFISPVENRAAFSELAFAGGLFYAPTQEGEIYASADGLNWERNFTGIGLELAGAVVGNGGILLVANNEIHRLSVPDSGSPAITGNPASVTLNEDGSLTLSGSATGAGVEYLWLRDGAPVAPGPGVSGERTASLRISPATLEHAGRYELVAANAFGSRASMPAVVSINPKAVILAQPQSMVGVAGARVTLAVEATGGVSYQWFRNGARIEGATGAALEIASAAAADAGEYHVEITNPVGIRTSERAALSITSRGSGYAFDPNWPAPSAEFTPAYVHQVVFQSDGKAYVIGNFSIKGANGATIRNFARLNADGTLDTTFAPLMPDQGVTAIYPLGDGRVMIGGIFAKIGNEFINGLARLNADGSLDTSYSAQILQQYTGVYAFAPAADGKIWAGGTFQQMGGKFNVKYLARLNADGAPDTSYTPPAALTDSIFAIHANADGSLLLGGERVSQRGLLTRLNANNTIDFTFPTGGNGGGPFGNGAFGDPHVDLIRPSGDGKYYAAGFFNSYSGAARIGVVRVHPSGELDAAFNTGLPTDANTVRDVAVFGDNVLVAGDFFTYNGTTNRQFIVMLDKNGALVDSPAFPRFDNRVSRAVVRPDGSVVVAGDFRNINGQPKAGLARIIEGGGGDGLPLAIVRQPQSARLEQGRRAVLLVAATGRGNLEFQWSKGGQPLEGETQPSLVIEAAGEEDAGVYRVQVKDSSGTLLSQEAALSFEQTGGGGFAEWVAGFNLPPALAGMEQDADNDGYSNAAEFAFGAHPGQPGSRPALEQQTVAAGNQSYPAVRYVRNKNATGVVIQVRASASVTFGIPADVVEAGPAEDLGNGLERVTVRSTVPFPNVSTFFFEVRAAAN